MMHLIGFKTVEVELKFSPGTSRHLCLGTRHRAPTSTCSEYTRGGAVIVIPLERASCQLNACACNIATSWTPLSGA